MKSTHYYIDESGGINSNSNFFILGCCKTDTSEDIRMRINSLRNELIDNPYFAFERKKILEHGFHATSNHFDVRARYFALIATLNIRAYILLLKKDSDYFKSIISENIHPDIIYSRCIKKLLRDRLIKSRKDKNTVIFEQYGSKINNWLKTVESVLDEIKCEIKSQYNIQLQCDVEVHDKNDINLSVIDYINFIFTQFFEHNKTDPRMEQNFKIIEPKIGLIYKLDKDLFYDKNNRLNIAKY